MVFTATATKCQLAVTIETGVRLIKKPDIMKHAVLLLNLLFGMTAILPAQEWKNYPSDSLKIIYIREQSKSRIETFFGMGFRYKFFVRIHGSRSSFENQLAEDWHEPGFKSECWMVAAGSAPGMDLLSPATWDTAACEHKSTDTATVRKLIQHELVHVYHGQWNKSPDFSETSGLDWFVEGLATYVSGQLDSSRRKQVLDLIRQGKVPVSLDQFWTGNARYGLSGAMTEYIDRTYGRQLFLELLPLTTKDEVLDKLNIKEDHLIKDFISDWPGLSGFSIE
jgi:hypothetical protein